jgi:hypothetical protein
MVYGGVNFINSLIYEYFGGSMSEGVAKRYITMKLIEGESRRGYLVPYVYDVISGFLLTPVKTEVSHDGKYLYYTYRLLEPGYYIILALFYKSTGSMEFHIIPVIARYGTLFSPDELVVVGAAEDSSEVFSKVKNLINEWRKALPQYAQRLEKENSSAWP